MWNHNKGNRDPARTNHRLTGKSCKTRSIWKSLRSLLQKDFRMMRSGKFFAVALGSLLLYTLFIHFGYVRFMDMEIYQVYLYDPAGTQRNVSPLVHPVASLEEMDRILHKDANSVGIHVTDGKPEVLCCIRVENILRKPWAATIWNRKTAETLPVNYYLLRLSP